MIKKFINYKKTEEDVNENKFHITPINNINSHIANIMNKELVDFNKLFYELTKDKRLVSNKSKREIKDALLNYLEKSMDLIFRETLNHNKSGDLFENITNKGKVICTNTLKSKRRGGLNFFKDFTYGYTYLGNGVYSISYEDGRFSNFGENMFKDNFIIID